MKRFIHLECNVCRRFVDKLVDNTHAAPDRCTITLRCTGRLLPVSYRSNASIATPPVSGLNDWRPRGVVSQTTSAISSRLINATCGQNNAGRRRLVLAVATTAQLTDASVATLTLNRRVEASTAFVQFIYRRDAAFSSIEGVESGLEKKTLSYNTATQVVDVYLNGIKLVRGLAADNYQLFGDTPSALPNSILFNSPIIFGGVSQVDVVISPKSSTAPTTIQLHRNVHDETRVGTGAWENIDYVDRFVAGSWRRYYLFTADLGSPLAMLAINGTFTVNPIVTLDYTFTSGDTFFLLAREPYEQSDRYTTSLVPLSNLVDSLALKYSVVAGQKMLQLPSDAVTTCYPPLRPTRFIDEPPLSSALSGVVDQELIDSQLITGPDA